MLLHLRPSRSQSLLSSPRVFIWFISTKLLECTDIRFQVSYLAPRQCQTSFLLTGQTRCSATLMSIHIKKQNKTKQKNPTNTLACVCQLFLQRPPTNVSRVQATFGAWQQHGGWLHPCFPIKILSESVEVRPGQRQLFNYAKAGAGHCALSKLEIRLCDSLFSPFLPK